MAGGHLTRHLVFKKALPHHKQCSDMTNTMAASVSFQQSKFKVDMQNPYNLETTCHYANWFLRPQEPLLHSKRHHSLNLSQFLSAWKHRVSWGNEDLELVTGHWRSPHFQLLSLHTPKLSGFWPHSSLRCSLFKTPLCTHMARWTRRNQDPCSTEAPAAGP